MSQILMMTDRLILRKMREDDLDNLHEIFSDPIAMRYYPGTKNEEETMQWIEWTKDNYFKFGVGLWIVEQKEAGTFLGQCGIVPQKVDGKIEMEIGYLFAQRAWGNGFATESAKACCLYGFKKLKLPRLVSLIDPENEPSIKVAERVGMHRGKLITKWGKALWLYSLSANAFNV